MSRRNQLRIWLEDRGLIGQRVHVMNPSTGDECPRCSWLYATPTLCRMILGFTESGQIIVDSRKDFSIQS